MSQMKEKTLQKTLNLDNDTLPTKYYKRKYQIVFYEPTEEETYIIGFNTIKDICKYKKMDINTTNTAKISCMLYNSLRTESHITYLLGRKMVVHLVDMIDDIN